MLSGTELTVKAREAIFTEMSPVARDVALEGLKRLQAGFQIALLVQYDLGTLINSLYEDSELTEDQKNRDIRRIADYWNQPNLNPATLYDLRNVATAFQRDFVKAQVEERLSNGTFLTWSHFKELQKIGQEKRQLAVLKNIRQHCWSAKELILELQGKKESAIVRSGGRKPNLPKTPVAMLQKIFASVQQVDNYLEAVSVPLDGLFLEMPPQEMNTQFIENLDNTLSRIDQMEEHLKSTRNKLRIVRKRATSVVSLESKTTSIKEESSGPKVFLAAKKLSDKKNKSKDKVSSEDDSTEGKLFSGRKPPRRVVQK